MIAKFCKQRVSQCKLWASLRHIWKDWHFEGLPFTAKTSPPQSQRCLTYIFTLIRKVQHWSHKRRRKKEFGHACMLRSIVWIYQKTLKWRYSDEEEVFSSLRESAVQRSLNFSVLRSEKSALKLNCSWKSFNAKYTLRILLLWTQSFSKLICNSLIKKLSNQKFCFS